MFGTSGPAHHGCMTVERVRFHCAGQRGGGQGMPFRAHEGLGGGGGGEKPPGGKLQCATAAMPFTIPGHGSPRPALVSVQRARPTQACCASARKPASSHAPGEKSGQSPAGVP